MNTPFKIQNPNYIKMWKFVEDNIPNYSRALGVNGYGGTYELPDKSLIIFVPSWEVKKQKETRQMHALNMVKEFLRKTNLTLPIEELENRAIELIKENIH